MKELIDQKDRSDYFTFISALISLLIIIQDAQSPEFILAGDVDWALLIPSLISAVFFAMRAEHLNEKIRERAELFSGRNYGDEELR